MNSLSIIITMAKRYYFGEERFFRKPGKSFKWLFEVRKYLFTCLNIYILKMNSSGLINGCHNHMLINIWLANITYQLLHVLQQLGCGIFTVFGARNLILDECSLTLHCLQWGKVEWEIGKFPHSCILRHTEWMCVFVTVTKTFLNTL